MTAGTNERKSQKNAMTNVLIFKTINSCSVDFSQDIMIFYDYIKILHF